MTQTTIEGIPKFKDMSQNEKIYEKIFQVLGNQFKFPMTMPLIVCSHPRHLFEHRDGMFEHMFVPNRPAWKFMLISREYPRYISLSGDLNNSVDVVEATGSHRPTLESRHPVITLMVCDIRLSHTCMQNGTLTAYIPVVSGVPHILAMIGAPLPEGPDGEFGDLQAIGDMTLPYFPSILLEHSSENKVYFYQQRTV